MNVCDTVHYKSGRPVSCDVEHAVSQYNSLLCDERLSFNIEEEKFL